jgi:hypothetical protein
MNQKELDEMKEELLARTKESFDRKDGSTGTRHFDTEIDIPFYRPQPTQGKPHILDIIPFHAGPNFPTKVSKPIKEGGWAYVLDLAVHKKVGPGKMTVVCPAKNYGNRCPVCEEVERLALSGLEYEDIPISLKRQCSYNVLVMDDAETESKGIQVWDVSHKYSEKAISALAIDARTGGYIPFASTDHNFGRSLAFDVGKDKYKTISGHRFEPRDYDIPPEILAEAFPLDTMIKIWTYDELCKILYGEEGKPPTTTETAAGTTAGSSLPRRSSRTENAGGQDSAVGPGASAGPTRTLRTLKKPEEKTESCPIGGNFADDHDKYEECKACEKFKPCAEAADIKEMRASQGGGETASQTAAVEKPPAETASATTGARRLLRRK